MGLFSCKKDKPVYKPFTDIELTFVSYSTGQNIKFIDTNNLSHNLSQSHYLREFAQFTGLSGKSNNFQEKYEVSFYSNNSSDLYLKLFLYGQFHPYTPGELIIDFSNYKVLCRADSLYSVINSIIINNNNYENVYSFKAYKNGIIVNNHDTATILYNKQYGVIRLLFPNGKTITRTN